MPNMPEHSLLICKPVLLSKGTMYFGSPLFACVCVVFKQCILSAGELPLHTCLGILFLRCFKHCRPKVHFCPFHGHFMAWKAPEKLLFGLFFDIWSDELLEGWNMSRNTIDGVLNYSSGSQWLLHLRLINEGLSTVEKLRLAELS